MRLRDGETSSQDELPQRWSDLFRAPRYGWYSAHDYDFVEAIIGALGLSHGNVTPGRDVMFSDDLVPDYAICRPEMLACCAALDLVPPRGVDSNRSAMKKLAEELRSDGRAQRAVEVASDHYLGSLLERQQQEYDEHAIAAAAAAMTQLLVQEGAELAAAAFVAAPERVRDAWTHLSVNGAAVESFSAEGRAGRLLIGPQALRSVQERQDVAAVGFECPKCKRATVAEFSYVQVRTGYFSGHWAYRATCRDCNASVSVTPDADLLETPVT